MCDMPPRGLRGWGGTGTWLHSFMVRARQGANLNATQLMLLFYPINFSPVCFDCSFFKVTGPSTSLCNYTSYESELSMSIFTQSLPPPP